MTVTTADRGAARVVTLGPPGAPQRLGPRDHDRDRRRDRGGGARRGGPVRGAARRRRALLSGRRPPVARSRPTRAAWAATIEGFQRMTRVVLAAPVPAIAAVDGVCVGRRARVRRELRPAPVHRSRPAAHTRGRHRARDEQRGHAVAARGARRDAPRGSCCSAARSATRPGPAEHGFATEMVAPDDARRPDRPLGRGLLAQLARRAGRHEGDAERALRRRCWPRRWTARPTTACACSTSRTPARRWRRSAPGGASCHMSGPRGVYGVRRNPLQGDRNAAEHQDRGGGGDRAGGPAGRRDPRVGRATTSCRSRVRRAST